MYRNINDPVSVPQIELYISEKLQKSTKNLHESLFVDDPAIIAALPAAAENDEENCNNEEEYNADLQDPSMNNAMMAFTNTLNKSCNCTPTTWQKHMHEFGKGTVASSRFHSH